VAAFTDLIDFLLRLLRDEDARAQFADDPQATLAGAVSGAGAERRQSRCERGGGEYAVAAR